MNIQMLERPIIQSIVWSIILILVLIFWPPVVEPEVISMTYNTYIIPEPDFISIAEVEVMEIIEEAEQIPLRYGFTPDDIYLMTVLLCGSKNIDGDGEYDIDFGNQDNVTQISLVLNVVMNRVMSDKFPNTVSEVIWAPSQFHPMARWTKGLPEVSPESYEIVKTWCEMYDSYELNAILLPESHLYFGGNGLINRSRERWKP